MSEHDMVINLSVARRKVAESSDPREIEYWRKQFDSFAARLANSKADSYDKKMRRIERRLRPAV